MKNMKRIHSITIKRMIDENPDTSYLGEYSSKAESDYAIDRKHSLDCQMYSPEAKQAIEQLERAIAYLETVRQLGEPPENIYWAAADEAQDTLVDLQRELEECDCGERGDMERNEYRYFNGNVDNYKGESPEDIRKYIRQDYERSESMNRGDWYYIGIRAEATIKVQIGDSKYSREFDPSLTQTITSGGLWGTESDSDESYLESIEKEELAALREQLHAIGFSKRAISAAMKNVERKDY